MSKTVTKNLEAFTLKNLPEYGITAIGMSKIGILMILGIYLKKCKNNRGEECLYLKMSMNIE